MFPVKQLCPAFESAEYTLPSWLENEIVIFKQTGEAITDWNDFLFGLK